MFSESLARKGPQLKCDAVSNYRRNHYVPVWYQSRFLLPSLKEQKFRLLDLSPDTVTDSNGRVHLKTAIRRWGPVLCFCEEDLYTTRFGAWISTEIEQRFFGEVDDRGRQAVAYWAEYDHQKIEHAAFNDMIRYMTLQKLRTPKGLAFLSAVARSSDRNAVLFLMQKLQGMYGALWAEAEWAIADASESETKFIVTDHPVTMYNLGCFPGSKWCREWRDPDPAMSGTHTVFALSADKLLILTNTSWVRNPYGDPRKPRPNPNLGRSGVFKFTDVHTGRKLKEEEVCAINYVLKRRAYRYLAATKEEWLFPERHLASTHWSTLGDGLLFMPDPRSIGFSGEIIMGGFPDGRPAEIWDEYGRRPGQRGFKDERLRDKEWKTFHAFQGEFARIHGPQHRGCSHQFGRKVGEDSPEYHRHLLSQEIPVLSKSRRGRRTRH